MTADRLQAGQMAPALRSPILRTLLQLCGEQFAHQVGEAAPLGTGQFGQEAMLVGFEKDLGALQTGRHGRSFSGSITNRLTETIIHLH